MTSTPPSASTPVTVHTSRFATPRSRHLELAYATTVYGAQGDTVDSAHLVLGEHTGAAAADVAMTRGRTSNVAHLVAETIEEARDQWAATFSRDRADLGPAHAVAARIACCTTRRPHRSERCRTA